VKKNKVLEGGNIYLHKKIGPVGWSAVELLAAVFSKK